MEGTKSGSEHLRRMGSGCLGFIAVVIAAIVGIPKIVDLFQSEKRVPNVIGLSPERATAEIENVGLGVEESGGGLFTSDTVCFQRPEAGAMTKDDVFIELDGDECPSTSKPKKQPDRDLASQYANSVESDLSREFPEVDKASCNPDGADRLSCQVRIAPTPANPLFENDYYDIRVLPGGDWEPIGTGP